MDATPGFGLVERARAIAPLIAGEAEDIERTRRLTPAVVSALIESGLYRALLPQSLGGAEAPIEIFMQMLEEVAKADASTAWCLGQCSVCAMIAASLDHDIARAAGPFRAFVAATTREEARTVLVERFGIRRDVRLVALRIVDVDGRDPVSLAHRRSVRFSARDR